MSKKSTAVKIYSKESVKQMDRAQILAESNSLWNAFCNENQNQLFKDLLKNTYNTFAGFANEAMGFKCFRIIE